MARVNAATDPSAINGLIATTEGNALTQLTGITGLPRSTGWRTTLEAGPWTTWIAAGSAKNAVAGQVWSAVFYIRASSARTIRTYFSMYQNSAYQNTTNPVDVSVAANTWLKCRLTQTIPSGVTFNNLHIHLDVPSSGSTGTLDMSSIRIEQLSDSTMEYADGDTAGWMWTGAVGGSLSQEATETGPEPGRWLQFF